MVKGGKGKHREKREIIGKEGKKRGNNSKQREIGWKRGKKGGKRGKRENIGKNKERGKRGKTASTIIDIEIVYTN